MHLFSSVRSLRQGQYPPVFFKPSLIIFTTSASDLGIEEEKVENTDENKDLFEKMKYLMEDKLKDVSPSASLKSHPVCITAEGEISIEMEKVLNAMPGNEQKISAQKVLEININHPVFEKLKSENYLRDFPKDQVYKKAAYYLGEINAIHPFREGNGRAQREFIRELLIPLGLHVDYSLCSPEMMLHASIESFAGDYHLMEDLFFKCIKTIKQ